MPVADLTVEEFPAFCEAVHGWAPFPWQEALLHRVLVDGWPTLIDVPTGLGKTAVLDVAVFASAMGTAHARRRIFLVVDRRLIVDQAYEHATRIQQALAQAVPGTVCHAVAARLAAAGDDGPVLDVTRMRGGITWSWLWLERPDRHAIITGTVDQIGSRLLFRGYGVGDQLRPIDAALTGTDSLIIVDEAHLSDPFLCTLRHITRLDQAGTAPPPTVVSMSASPGETSPDTHRITSADEQHPVAAKRLTAAKRLHLVTVPAAKDAATDAVADALAYWAAQIGAPGLVTGVVANTVAMARAVFTRLQAEPGRCVLLTGRIRPVDREYLLREWYPLIRAGASRQASEPLYVVATQTIEVGADIDLDGLVTESASLPALIQRLGRDNRRGDRAQSQVIAVHADALADRVYGEARQHTWLWLASLTDPVRHRAGRSAGDLGRGIDASPAALRRRLRHVTAGDLEQMHGARPYTPLVSNDTLDTWARTSPVPHPDIPVTPYLHGIGAGEPTISIVWRADTRADEPQQWARSGEQPPPSADESIELPVSTAKRWLATLPPAGPGQHSAAQAAGADELSDTESYARSAEDADAANGTSLGGAGRVALRYGGPGNSELATAAQVRAGDLLIVPAAWGGCDRFGWHPASTAPVTDIADLTGGTGGTPAAIRIGPTLVQAISALAPALAEPVRQLIAQIIGDLADDIADTGLYRAMLAQMLNAPPDIAAAEPLPHERVLRRLAYAGRLTEPNQTTGRNQPVPIFSAAAAGWNDDASAAGTSASAAARPMELLAHQAAVRDRAGQVARNLNLPEQIVQAVSLAAAYHDEGKRDPRFQRMLHAGDRWRHTAASAPLAKSGMDPADRTAFRRARQLAGYPNGMRHEALSARIAALRMLPASASFQPTGNGEASGTGPDPDLVIHLVATHHGYARPLLPPITDPDPVDITVHLDGADHAVLNSAETVDWDGPGRFARLCEQHGRWGLALLESIVRLADIWCSARSEASS